MAIFLMMIAYNTNINIIKILVLPTIVTLFTIPTLLILLTLPTKAKITQYNTSNITYNTNNIKRSF